MVQEIKLIQTCKTIIEKIMKLMTAHWLDFGTGRDKHGSESLIFVLLSITV